MLLGSHTHTHTHVHTEAVGEGFLHLIYISTSSLFVYVVHNCVYRNNHLQFQVEHLTPSLSSLSLSLYAGALCVDIEQPRHD